MPREAKTKRENIGTLGEMLEDAFRDAGVDVKSVTANKNKNTLEYQAEMPDGSFVYDNVWQPDGASDDALVEAALEALPRHMAK